MAPAPVPIAGSSSPRPESPAGLSATHHGSPSSIPQIPRFVGSPRPEQSLTRPTLTRDASSEQLPTNAVTIEELTEAQKAAIVRKHLLSADDQRAAAAESALSSSPNSQSNWAGRIEEDPAEIVGGDDDYPIPYTSVGGSSQHSSGSLRSC